MSSLFTQIINREVPAEIIYEDDDVIAFLDIKPVRKWHTLLVPKEESRRLYDVEPALAAMLMITTQELMIHMKEVLWATYIAVYVEWMEVDHTHIHLIPYMANDTLNKRERESYSNGEMAAYADRLRISE